MRVAVLSPERDAPGAFVISGRVSMIAAHPSGLLTTPEAARLVGVKPVTIRAWRRLGWLEPQGLSERGYPLHTPEAVREAEALVRENGIAASGIDPRLLRTGSAAA